MSTSGLSVGSSAGSPITISGLASGLDTSSIISALMSVERVPLTRLTSEQTKLQGQQKEIQTIQSSLQQLAFAASEFVLPSSFETTQTVTSSEPSRVSATTSSGAAIGGHEIEVKQLANSAQRTFTFTSPASEDKLTIDGHEFTVKAGGTAKELASAINSSSTATVYAVVLEDGSIALSDRATGNNAEFIKVADPGGVLNEVAGSAKEGKNAEYSIDGVAGSSASNIIANAIPGVTLTLNGLTSTGPVTIDVQPPGISASVVESQVQSFIKIYNSTVQAIQKQLTTKPPTGTATSSEPGAGALFGDVELSETLSRMRESMYEPISGLAGEMSSPFNIGISTGAASGGGATSSSTLEGQLTLNSATLTNAIQNNPTGAKEMLERWSQSLQGILNGAAEPGGTLEARINGDGAQLTELTKQISSMNEMLAQREKALQATYAALEGVLSQNSSQSTWLSSQEKQLQASGI